MILKIVGISPDASPETIKALSHINPGSVMVAITRDHIVPDPDGVWIYYEGGIYDRPANQPPTDGQKTEYAKIAAGRAYKSYPTVAKTYLPSQKGLVPLGFVDTATWEVVF